MANYDKYLEDTINSNPELENMLETMEKNYTEMRAEMMNNKEFKKMVIQFTERSNGIEKALIKRLYANHKEDGNMFPIIVGFINAKVLAHNIPMMGIKDLLEGNGAGMMFNLAKTLTVPLQSEYYDDFQREEIEESLNNL